MKTSMTTLDSFLPFSPQLSRIIPFSFAKTHQLVVVALNDYQLDVFVTEATPAIRLAELARIRTEHIVTHCVSDTELNRALQLAYAQQDHSAQSVADEVEGHLDLDALMQDIPALEDLLDMADEAPIIRMMNALFTQAAREGASDIHLELFESYSAVRFRLDGTLRDIIRPRKQLHAALVSRIKIMAQMDIAEKRLPQDGRINLRIGGKPLDIRVSTLPTSHGERVVMRLLDKDLSRLDLARLGMSTPTLQQMDQLIHQPHGIVLVTGPTGSGKTTTLYAALRRLDATELNIMTVEDPVEYDLANIGQTPVNAKIEMTFARALRAILRQDPDVVMIGEIRDLETAQIAVQASLTGHLVLATLHTNDAVSAVTRLVDMGVEPFLLASSLLGVLAQRLVRQLCADCKQPVQDATHYRAVGCPKCNGTGYRGRMGIHELFVIDDEVRQLLHQRKNEYELRDYATQEGMVSMRDDGMRWIASGDTTPEEVLRVTRD
jgi:general secretion pathway protein E